MVGQRAAIIATVRLRTSFCYLCLLAGLYHRRHGVRPVIGEITPNSIAAQAQKLRTVRNKAVDGIETPDWDAVRLQLVSKLAISRRR